MRHSLLAPTCMREVAVGGRKGQEGTEVARFDCNLEATMVRKKAHGLVDGGG